MKILAIDTSSIVATVAILTDGVITAEYTLNHKKMHSRTLLPMIEEIFRMTEMKKTGIDAIAVTKGPGSYTGLRIGSATAKGMGLAWDVPLIGVPTIDALAYNFYSSVYTICPIMDARRGQVYAGIYRFCGTKMHTSLSQCIIMMEDLILKLDEMNEPVMFLGDGVSVHRTLIDQKMSCEHYYAPASMNRHKASSIATLAALYYKEGRFETAQEHKPEYLRATQAERELHKNDTL